MIIVIYNFKGGEGKSRIAQNLALTMQYSIITNDVFNPIENIFPENRILKVWPNQEFPKVSISDDIIFDLGGYPDNRVIEILKQAHYIIVPITNEIDNIQVGINTIDTIVQYNNNIVIIANKTKNNDFMIIKNDLKDLYDYPIFEIKQSTAMCRLSIRKKSIQETMKHSPLLRHAYKKINDQFNTLINFLLKNK